MSGTPIDPDRFREIMGHFGTGVTVVTTTSPEGRPVGMTVSSFTSVSLDPPLISVCVDHQADVHPALSAAPGFVVNILGEGQEALSRQFAASGSDRFAGVAYRESLAGQPVLGGCLAHLECRRHAAVEAGDHTVFLGEVTGGAVSSGQPLLYYRGGYTGLAQP